MTDPVLTYEKRGAIAYVTLNRPRVINCINGEMYDLLEEAVDNYAADSELRCMIISGAGGNFSSGGDMKWWAQARAEAEASGKQLEYDFPAYRKMLHQLVKPVIAALDGYCLASGFALALYCCDIRIASDRLKMGTMAVQRALNLAGNRNQYAMPLTWYTGLGNTLYLRLTGKHLSAEEALRMGLVNEVVPAEQLMNRATEVAEIVAQAHPVAVARDKILYRRAQEVPGSFFNGLQDLIHSTDHFDDYREGSKAFLEKRKPKFS